jgi:hypothetical protein
VIRVAAAPLRCGALASGASVSHGPPLTVQFAGRVTPTTTKPKLVDAPGASEPFHDAFLKIKRWAARVNAESQLLEIWLFVGRSKTTVQLLTSPGPSFVIRYSAW